ncbi:transglycosylase SLT domain-containing protein [Salmonella enterica subsp. enterica serovar Enteritidis]|nr:transglycosylase SLT domain-containing protein [Salmonella enterica subsp. enterica serovar Enteritidis]
MFRSVTFLALLLSSGLSHAYCFKEAGKAMQIDPLLLLAISIQESRLKSEAIGVNRNSQNQIVSMDYGLMQINSKNLEKIFSNLGINRSILLNQPCINVYAGAYILRDNFNKWGENWWSVGAYNAGVKKSSVQQAKREKYSHQVKGIYMNLIRLDKEGKIDW